MRKELVLDGGDRGRRPLQQRVPVTRVADRSRQHLLQAHRAIVPQEEHEGVEATRNAGR
jgi:hypothetical protein